MHPRCWRYAKGFVDKDEPDITLEPHAKTAVDEHETEIAPEPYEFQTAANDQVSSTDHERRYCLAADPG